MDKKWLWIGGAVAGGAVVALCGCGVIGFVIWKIASKPTLVGRWEAGMMAYQFEDDGTVLMGQKGTAGGIPGKYKVIDDTHLEMDFGGGPVRMTYKLTGDKLELRMEEPGLGMQPLVYERVKKR
jgi:hypothetical protein